MNLTEQLKRDGNLLRAAPRPKLKLRGSIKKVSTKREQDNRVYLKRRKVFLNVHPICMACGSNRATDIHHMKRRGIYFLDESTWMTTCRPCHLWIHANPSEARKFGLLK